MAKPVVLNLRQWGAFGEAAAADWFTQQGYTVLAKNWHHSRHAELDLVVLSADQQTVVFVEVKARKAHTYATALEALTPTKARHLKLAAEAFLQQHSPGLVPASVQAYRFDWVVVCLPAAGQHAPPALEHWPNVLVD